MAISLNCCLLLSNFSIFSGTILNNIIVNRPSKKIGGEKNILPVFFTQKSTKFALIGTKINDIPLFLTLMRYASCVCVKQIFRNYKHVLLCFLAIWIPLFYYLFWDNAVITVTTVCLGLLWV